MHLCSRKVWQLSDMYISHKMHRLLMWKEQTQIRPLGVQADQSLLFVHDTTYIFL